MNLGQLIATLEKMPQDRVVKHGFSTAMSFRGYYDQLAFEPADDVTIGSMLAEAKGALGRTFEGYKGGYFKMDEYTACWVPEYGMSTEEGVEILIIGWLMEHTGGTDQ